MSATTTTAPPSSAALRAALHDAEPVARVARAEVATLERGERAAALKGMDALSAHRDQVAAQRQEADRLEHVVADLREQLDCRGSTRGRRASRRARGAPRPGA